MNRRQIIPLLFSVAAACTVTWAIAAGNADDKAIRKEYERYRKAILRKDIDAVSAMLTPGFAWKMPDGTTLNRNETAKTLREHLAAVKTVKSMDITIYQLTVQGNKAVALLTETTKATLPGKGGKTEVAVSKDHYREVWVRSASRWMLHRAETLSSAPVLRSR
jgi:ketosteroid isomerase-like protein